MREGGGERQRGKEGKMEGKKKGRERKKEREAMCGLITNLS